MMESGKLFEASVYFLYSFTVNKHVVFSSIKQQTILQATLRTRGKNLIKDYQEEAIFLGLSAFPYLKIYCFILSWKT